MTCYTHKTIAVLGFGLEGESVIKFLLHQSAKITVFDERAKDTFDTEKILALEKKGVQFVFGSFKPFESFDFLVRSPGIMLARAELADAHKKGIEITSGTKIFFDLCPSKIIGVTGTKGKGTTSTLIYEMIKESGQEVYLGGNIGTPPLEFLEKLTPDSWVVLELSSFQLQDLTQSPHIAVMLMTTSEHLDYHKDVYEYIDAKRNILRFQTNQDIAVLNKDYPATNESDTYTEAQVYKVSREQGVEQGCFVRGDKIYLKMSEHEEEIVSLKDIALPGRHNLENVCAAIVAATFAKAGMKAITTVIKQFHGLPHRLELVRTVRGVRYYNDSFSTTPETAIAAIEAFDDPKVLILGGSSKGSDFSEMGTLINSTESIKAIIGIGVEWKRMKSQFQISNFKFPIIEGKKTMEEVIKAAAEIATLGDIVLLSPACASFGMFENYKDRGNQFNKAVNAL